ncbi:hypothetical protein [Edaphobacter modestus]|uniref:Uncharacterized protein n=1 Tax=Edaphobacter modestus TaxID=388466 RepID=A0A4Q7XY98_9BACT|nr:hypothetical protein [Edaphobacter modestus]RZU28894.1 hypothetical protein BDD14_6477 [Edaphobacter modestus]
MSNSKIKYVKVHGFTGRGANAKEAKQDAIRQIESLNQGHWEPTIIEWRGHSVLVFRGLNGWQSTFLRHDVNDVLTIRGYAMGDGSYREAVASAQRHVADLGFLPGEEPIDTFPDFLTDEGQRKDLIFTRKWRMEYKTLVDKGFSDIDARRILSRTSGNTTSAEEVRSTS